MDEITTVAELEALPPWSVLRTKGGKLGWTDTHRDTGARIFRYGTNWYELSQAIAVQGPLTLVHHPELPDQSVLHERVQAALAIHGEHVGGLHESRRNTCICIACQMARALSDPDPTGLLAG